MSAALVIVVPLVAGFCFGMVFAFSCEDRWERDRERRAGVDDE